jgi:hypothetical protein
MAHAQKKSKLITKRHHIRVMLTLICIIECAVTSCKDVSHTGYNSQGVGAGHPQSEQTIAVATILQGNFHKVSDEMRNVLNNVGVRSVIYGSIVYAIEVPVSQVDISRNAISKSKYYKSGCVVLMPEE